MKNNILTLALAAALFAPAAQAAAAPADPLGACVKAAQKVHPGQIRTLRAEIEDGQHQYELVIKGNDGKVWGVECNSKTAKITEDEQVVRPDDPAFTSRAKISLDAALKAALAKYPGTVVRFEYEIEPDENDVAYEFDIKQADGRILEVEVSATTGKVEEPEEVLYQIGGAY